jgi:hypothetical protein
MEWTEIIKVRSDFKFIATCKVVDICIIHENTNTNVLEILIPNFVYAPQYFNNSEIRTKRYKYIENVNKSSYVDHTTKNAKFWARI